MNYYRMLLVTKTHHERDEEKAVDKNQAGDIGSVSTLYIYVCSVWLSAIDSICYIQDKEHSCSNLSYVKLHMGRKFLIPLFSFGNTCIKVLVLFGS